MDFSKKDIKKNTYFNEIFSMISELKMKPDVCSVMVSPEIKLTEIKNIFNFQYLQFYKEIS